MATKIVNVSELKSRLATLITDLETGGVPIYITNHGKPKAVLVKYDDYEALLEKVDDLEDILAMEQALSSPEQEAVSLKEYELQRAAQIRG